MLYFSNSGTKLTLRVIVVHHWQSQAAQSTDGKEVRKKKREIGTGEDVQIGRKT